MNWPVILLIALIVGVAVVVRLVGISGRVFWYDELHSLTYATQDLADIRAVVHRFDPHPALYYLQLHFWTLLSTDTAWVRMNSVFWSLATLPAIFLTGRQLFCVKAGLLAMGLFAVAPLAVFYAQEVRQYAMQMCGVAWSLFFLQRLISLPARALTSVFFAISLLAVVYSHGTGFLVLPAAASYAISALGRDLFSKKGRAILIAGLVATLLTLPWLAQAAGQTLGHLTQPGPERFLSDLTIFLFGEKQDVAVRVAVFSGAILSLLIALIRDARNLAICFIIVPIFTALALSALITPIWHIKVIAPFFPILPLALAGALARLGRRFSDRFLVPSFAAAVALMLLPYSLSVNKTPPGRQAHFDLAAHLVETLPRGATVGFHSNRDAWGVIWYLAGPGVAQPLSDRQIITSETGLKILYLRHLEHRRATDELTAIVVRRGDPNLVSDAPQFGNMFVIESDW